MFVMKYFLYIVFAVVCDAGQITRIAEHPYFSNFRSVYHGHGATSYQNVQIDNHRRIPYFKNNQIYQDEGLTFNSEYHHEATPEDVSFGKITPDHLGLNHDVLLYNQLYEHHNHDYDYEQH